MTSTITANVDSVAQKAAEDVFSSLGITTAGAVNLFICAVAHCGAIPFATVTQVENETDGIKFGIADGQYEFATDFDQRFCEMDAEIAEMFG